jgi:hypothetical protein
MLRVAGSGRLQRRVGRLMVQARERVAGRILPRATSVRSRTRGGKPIVNFARHQAASRATCSTKVRPPELSSLIHIRPGFGCPRHLSREMLPQAR